MNKELILIDLSWVIYRMWYAHKDLFVQLLDGTVLKSGHVYGVARLLKSLSMYHPKADFILCLDGVAEHGKSLSTEYKADRGRSEAYSAFDDLGVIVECALSFPRVKVAWHKSLEADEVIAFFARSLDYEKIIVYSGDCDMLQLLADGENIFISKEYDASGLKLIARDTYYNDSKYTDKFVGVRLDVLPLYRAMIGDSSDNLAGFPRLRKKVAKTIVERYNTLYAIERACADGDNELFPKGFNEFLPRLRVNYDIMKLPTVADLGLRGMIPHLLEDGDIDFAKELYSLYKIKSVSPVSTFIISDEETEQSCLSTRELVNLQWRHPNSLKG